MDLKGRLARVGTPSFRDGGKSCDGGYAHFQCQEESWESGYPNFLGLGRILPYPLLKVRGSLAIVGTLIFRGS